MTKFKVGEFVRLHRSPDLVGLYQGVKEGMLLEIREISIEDDTWYSVFERTGYRFREQDLSPICKLNRDAKAGV